MRHWGQAAVGQGREVGSKGRKVSERRWMPTGQRHRGKLRCMGGQSGSISSLQI